ncbi:MAG: hypothetical protein H6753_04470 [Candidatus Omnitrophica bacterium]|nr:hypothetical protein [Candidatus Omnitrophota bacterium]
MKIVKAAMGLLMIVGLAAPVVVSAQDVEKSSAAMSVSETDLSQYIYSYGAVLKVGAAEIVLQEYDYDSDVEKEVAYQIDPAVKLDGFKAISDLAPEDVVEIYYSEQDGKKTAKIIRREISAGEDETPEDL